MTWLDGPDLQAGLLALVLGALVGWFLPLLIASLPEPAPSTDANPTDTGARATLPAPPAKVLYRDLAARPGLSGRMSMATGLVAAVLVVGVGIEPALAVLLPLVPIGVALTVIDWHTTLLPTRIIAPTYVLVIVAIGLAGVLSSDTSAIVRAGFGWLVMGGFFFVLWLIYPRGLGYGDVRLSGVLGLALGYLGWPALVIGMYAAFLIGGLGGALLGVLRIVDRKRFPFGPFMLVAAVVGVLFGPAIASGLGY